MTESKMTESRISARSWLRALAIGLGVSLLTALVMVPMMKSGVSPLPKPLGLAFAETLLGRSLPLPVGLAFHAVYVTFWSVVYVCFVPRPGIKTALLLALGLWLVVLMGFFPLIGWGFAGSAVSTALIPASFMPHLLFGLLLWALNKFIPSDRVLTAPANHKNRA